MSDNSLLTEHPSAKQQQSLSRLPAECLEMIFGYLDQDRSALHALLRVNRQFFRLVVPILYRSPFRLLESRAETWPWIERLLRQVHLLQLFLYAAQIKREKQALKRTQAVNHQRKATMTDKKRHHTPLSHAYASTATTIATPISPSIKSVSDSSVSNHSVHNNGQCEFNVQQQSEQSWRSSILRTKSKMRPSWWPRRRLSSPSTTSSSPSIYTSSSYVSSASTSSSFSNWLSSQSSSYSTSHSAFSLFFSSKNESNVNGDIQERQPWKKESELTSEETINTDVYSHNLAASIATNVENIKISAFQFNPSICSTACSRSRVDSTSIITNNNSSNHCNCSPTGWTESQADPSFPYHFDQKEHFQNDNIIGRSDYSSTRGGLDGHVSSEDPYIQVGYSHHHSYSQAFNNVDDNKNNVDEINGSDNITDDDDTLEPDIIFSPWRNPYFEPYLGPFEALPDQSSFSIWANMLQQKLKSMIGIDTGNITTPQQQFQQQHRAKGLTIDYLQYYVDQSHVGVVRTLHFIFILLPFGSFEELSRNRDMIPTMTPLPEYGRVSSTPGVQSFFNIFNPIKPPLGSALEKAQYAYVGVEWDLLHHSSHNINTITVSVSRLPAILSLSRQQRSSSLGQQTLTQSTPASLEGRPRSTTMSSLTSLFSSLSLPMSNISISMPSFSSFRSTKPSHPVIPPSSDSLGIINRHCCLRNLTRIEFHDIHHRFDDKAIVDFLTSHSQTYDTIREVKIGGPNDVGKWSAPGVVSILLCLKKIRVLDMTEWREAINYLDMIPTQDLKTLLLGDVRMTYNRSESMGSDQHHDTQIWALQNCRQLQELRMPVLIDGLFEWAVQERKSRLDSYSQSTHPRSFFSTTSDWIDDLAPVQLKNIHLTGSCTSPLITTLLHVVDAFRDSIQVLQSTSWIDSTETRSYNQSLAWTWCLPNLHVLDLQGEIAYLFRIQSLESCPQLRVLRLVLPHSFLPPSSSSSSLLSKTEELAMESLNSFPCSSPTRRTCAFHSRGDLRRRQRQLHYTSLADVLGDDDEYNSEDDSSCTCDNIQSNTNSHKANASVPYVSSSSHRLNLFSQLKELKLVGDWGLANESLLGIAKKMPRLERLSLLRCESNKLTAQGLIRAMPSLRRQQRHQSSSDLDIVYDNDPTGGRYSRVRWIEICKSWQREIEAAMVGTQKLDINKSDGASFNEQQQQYLRAFEAAVKEGVSPLQIVYSY